MRTHSQRRTHIHIHPSIHPSTHTYMAGWHAAVRLPLLPRAQRSRQVRQVARGNGHKNGYQRMWHISMYIHTFYAYLHILCIHTFTSVRVVNLYTCMYEYMYVPVCVCVCVIVCNTHTQTHSLTHTHTYTNYVWRTVCYTYTCVCVHVCVYVCI